MVAFFEYVAFASDLNSEKGLVKRGADTISTNGFFVLNPASLTGKLS